MATNTEADGATTDAAKPNKMKLIIIIAVIVLVLAGVGGGAAFFLMGDSESSADAPPPGPKLSETMLYSSMQPPFVVSYMVQGRQHYVQVGIDIATHNPAVIDALAIHDPMIRSEILRMVGEHSFNQLRTGVGKLELLQQLQNRLNAILLQEAQVEGVEAVLLNTFVMQ